MIISIPKSTRSTTAKQIISGKWHMYFSFTCYANTIWHCFYCSESPTRAWILKSFWLTVFRTILRLTDYKSIPQDDWSRIFLMDGHISQCSRESNCSGMYIEEKRVGDKFLLSSADNAICFTPNIPRFTRLDNDSNFEYNLA